MKQSNLIIWGGIGEWQLCFNLTNCLKAQRDDKETANLVKNSHYGFWYWFLSSLSLLTLFSYNFWKATLSYTEQIEDMDKTASFQEVMELLFQLPLNSLYILQLLLISIAIKTL